MTIAKQIILALVFLLSAKTIYAQQFTTLDIVKVNTAYEKEAMYFYNENWKLFRMEAYKKGFISGFEMLKTDKDSTNHFQLILITRYEDSLSFHQKEQNFAPIMKNISPNGPKMLNNIPRKEFLEYLVGYDTFTILDSKKQKKRN